MLAARTDLILSILVTVFLNPKLVITRPHVYSRVEPEHLIAEAQRLVKLLQHYGVILESGLIQASFDPVDNIGILALIGVNDACLRFDKITIQS